MSTQAPTRRTGFRRRAAAGLTALILPLAAMVGLATPAEAATSATATYTKTQDWGTGFGANWTVKNTGTTTISSWTVEWDYPMRHRGHLRLGRHRHQLRKPLDRQERRLERDPRARRLRLLRLQRHRPGRAHRL